MSSTDAPTHGASALIERIDYSAAPDRPPLRWPGGARVALWVAPNIEHYEFRNFVGSREHEILDELKPAPGEHVLRKTTIGAFASTNIDSLLRALGCEQLYLTGVSTNMCVETTAREAADRGYLVTLVEDACGTTHEDLHQVTMRNFQRLFGRVRATDAALDELHAPVAA